MAAEPKKIIQNVEAMEPDQEAFISRRYKKESKLYIRSMNILLILAVLSPFAYILLKLLFAEQVQKDVLVRDYFLGLGYMLIFFGIIAAFAYYIKIHALAQDKKHKKRIVERVHIVEKKFMKLNNTHHFYLDSPTLVSVQVTPEDFENFQLNDEINVEYAKYSKEYFGYF